MRDEKPLHSALPQIRVVHPARLTRRILARALRNEMTHVRHQHVAAELFDQRVLAILATPRTVITREPQPCGRAIRRASVWERSSSAVTSSQSLEPVNFFLFSAFTRFLASLTCSTAS
jgi:hypothetical protein